MKSLGHKELTGVPRILTMRNNQAYPYPSIQLINVNERRDTAEDTSQIPTSIITTNQSEKEVKN